MKFRIEHMYLNLFIQWKFEEIKSIMKLSKRHRFIRCLLKVIPLNNQGEPYHK